MDGGCGIKCERPKVLRGELSASHLMMAVKSDRADKVSPRISAQITQISLQITQISAQITQISAQITQISS